MQPAYSGMKEMKKMHKTNKIERKQSHGEIQPGLRLFCSGRHDDVIGVQRWGGVGR